MMAQRFHDFHEHLQLEPSWQSKTTEEKNTISEMC